jgi:hypothetical protein
LSKIEVKSQNHLNYKIGYEMSIKLFVIYTSFQTFTKCYHVTFAFKNRADNQRFQKYLLN